ncbi:EscU/YscU/HrcU family type III secretion system export apparatus switch protein [Sphingobium boeckii]|uniref:Flagellar biosynthetic protein FlhB n=1 Tax=Sphingobium boeckii TaxID=1082345 RepID=A0A7W9AJ57_9SPHN|nr:flagellar type III secretion system protein FlhB [Sphingobium boeckii]MBB5686441.1 flagellar biosynthetic protein FlhB [Sphingobium boeckii]
MADQADKDQKTEDPTDKKRRDSAEEGDVLQSRELAIALVMGVGAAWLIAIGPMMIEAISTMLGEALRFNAADIENFDPAARALRLGAIVILPLVALFAMTLAAAFAAPAMLGSLGFRAKSFAFKGNRINPATGIKRIFSMNGLIELVKSIAKVGVIAVVGWYVLMGQSDHIMSAGRQELGPALSQLASTFTLIVAVMAGALFLIAMVDVPAQFFQRLARMRMTKQEVKEEGKQSEGSPEVKQAIRRKQFEAARGSARQAVAEATVILVNPTHFAVALRYRPGYDAAPVLLARGRGAMAQAIREAAGEAKVPVLSYPSLARAIYFTTRTGDIVREDLYIAVATVLAFVFNLDRAMAEGIRQPNVDVPEGARYDEEGRKQA